MVLFEWMFNTTELQDIFRFVSGLANVIRLVKCQSDSCSPKLLQ